MEFRRPLNNDFEKMVTLQNENLFSVLQQSEKQNGFLSAAFTAKQFQTMDNDLCVVVCAEEEKIIGYACASSIDYNKKIPLIAIMLKHFSEINFKNKMLSEYNSFVYGPACIDKPFRGKGILEVLFKNLQKSILQEHPQLELLTTIISTDNERSVSAHKKLGMEIVGQFEFSNQAFWILAFSFN